MTPTHQPSSRASVIVVGRAYLQMVVAANVLLERGLFWAEKLLLKLVKALYNRRLQGLQGLLALLPEDVVAEVLAGQGDGGPTDTFSSN